MLAQEKCQERVARSSSFFHLSPQSGQNQLKKTPALERPALNCNPNGYMSSSSRSVGKRLGWVVTAALTTDYGDASSCYLSGAWEVVQKPYLEHISFTKIGPQRWSSIFFLSISFLKNIKRWWKRVCKMLV